MTGRPDDDFAAEIDAHLVLEADRLMRERGMSEAQARERARKTFGNRGAALEQFHDSRRFIWLEHIWRDVRHAARALRRAPLFTVVAVLTLAVGIGSVTATFSVLNGLILGSLPYPDASRIVSLSEYSKSWSYSGYVSPMAIAELHRASRVFESVGAWDDRWGGLVVGEDAVNTRGIAVDPRVISILGIRPEHGRVFTPDEYRDGAPVALISDEVWRRRFAASERILNRTVRFGGRVVTIVGIVHEGQRFPDITDVWLPTPSADARRDSAWQPNVHVIAKLRRDASVRDATRELRGLGNSIASRDPVHSARDQFGIGDMAGRPGLGSAWLGIAFILAASFVMLIACANVGSLLLVRGAARRREMAIRASLGGSRRRLIAQNLAESALLAVTGALVGTILTSVILKVLLAALPTDHMPSWVKIGIDWRVLVFTVALTAITTVVVGLSPARIVTRVDLSRALKAGGDTSVAGGSSIRPVRRRVIGQLALSLALFLGASGLWISYRSLAHIDLGYERGKIVTGFINIDQDRYTNEQSIDALVRPLLANLRLEPAVASAAFTGRIRRFRGVNAAPAPRRSKAPQFEDDELLDDHGHSFDESQRPGWRVGLSVVSPSYMSTLGLALEAGRWFEPSDDSSAAAVVVVNAAMARAVAGNSTSALERTIHFGRDGRLGTIVGVLSDIGEVNDGPGGTFAVHPAMVYVSDAQASGFNPVTVVVRARDAASSLGPVVRRALRKVDPDAPVDVRPLEFEADLSLLLMRTAASILGGFAAAALFLAVLGTFGIVAYDITQRTREIGIRIALGGTPRDVIGWVMRRASTLVLWGLGVGVALYLAEQRIVRASPLGSVNVGIAYTIAALALFAAIALAACYAPALAVLRTDPVSALRSE